jgi:outer membrane cobalamin receptor
MQREYVRAVAAVFAAAAMVAWPPDRAAAQHEQHEDHGAAADPAGPVMVTGRIVCEDGPALPGAVVQLFHEMDGQRHLMGGGITDQAGRFAVRIDPGRYTLEVVYIGHEDHVTEIGADGAGGPVPVGEIRMARAAIGLESISVRAERDEVRVRSGSTVVDGQAAAAAGGTVADLLRTVPGLEIEPDGRLSLRGGTGVLVLVNGRRTALEGNALIAFLNQMPASSLDRIEAGTTASASAEADGAAGVVNLVFHESDAARTNLRSLSGSVATEDHYVASAAATGSLGSAVGWNLSYSYSSMRPRTESDTRRETLFGGASVGLSHQASLARAHHRLHSVLGGATARLTASTTLGVDGSFSWMAGEFDNVTEFRDQDGAGTSVERTTASLLEHVIPSGDASVMLRWTGGPDGRVRFGSELAMGGVHEDFTGDYRDGDGVPFLDTDMTSEHRQYSLSNDLTVRLGAAEIEVGHRSQRRTIDVAYWSEADAGSDRHDFGYDDWIHAGYVSALGEVAGATVRGGVRVEAERATVAWTETGPRDAVRLFPSLEVAWPADVSARTRYRLGYGRRINRPESGMLNPYSMGEDDMNAVVGNPALRSEVVDQLEVGVERHDGGRVLQLTPFVRLTRDPIRPLKAVTESGRATTTLHNLDRTLAAGADASVRLPLGPRVTATLSGSAYRLELEGMDYRNEGVYVTVRGHVDVELGARTALQLYGYRRGSQAIEQGEILPAVTSELALTHRWGAEQRGRVTLRISDPFASDELAFRVADPSFIQESQRRVSRPLASLFVSWAVGGRPREARAGLGEEMQPTIF